jgi:hypothetical protein
MGLFGELFALKHDMLTGILRVNAVKVNVMLALIF